ncbi:MAG: sigma-70 family RNA polymerase sigma factor [Rubripirellula sp.]
MLFGCEAGSSCWGFPKACRLIVHLECAHFCALLDIMVSKLPELAECQDFLLAFVNSKLPAGLRRYVGASDIVQNVMFAATTQRDRFQGTTEEEFQAWLLRIAQGKIVDGVRKFRVRKIDLVQHAFPSCICGTDGVEETPSALVSIDEQAAALLAAIQRLPEDIREIISFRYIDSLTFDQIGQRMILPASTVRRRWLEGCQILKQQLEHSPT